MGVLSKLFGSDRAPMTPQPDEIMKTVMSWDTGKMAKLMKHPDGGVRRSVVETVAMVGKMRPTGGNQFQYRADTGLAPAMAKFLIEHVNDPDPAVREFILTTLEKSKLPEVEKVVKALRAAEAKEPAVPGASPRQSEAGQTSTESEEKKIERLFKEAKDLPWEESEKKVGLYTTLLELIASSKSAANPAAVLRNRGIAYRSLKRYGEALQDFRAELEQAQNQGDRMRIMQCQKLIEETEGWQRKEEILAGGGAKAEKLQAMDRDKFLVWNDGPDADRAFESYFVDLTDADPDVRAEAARILAEPPKSQQRLIAIYQRCVGSDPQRASLAGRVLGRNAAKGSDDMIHAEIARMLYGLDLSFLPCPCVHCGKPNLGIPAPPKAPWVAYYHQDNDRGAYAVPVLCDGCGKEFFVVWDQDPR